MAESGHEGLDTREWLLTNGLGSFASGTVCDAHTRTYHGWLIAALNPPGQRTLLLSRIDATLEVDGRAIELGTNFWTSGAIAPSGYMMLRSFHVDPVPTWVWGQDGWQLSREIILPYGLLNDEPPQFCNRVFIRYRYEGQGSALLKLRPLIGDRNFHHQQQSDSLRFSQVVEPHRVFLQAILPEGLGTPWQLGWTQGRYQPDGIWYWNYRYPEETERQLNDREDLFSPGCLTVTLNPGESITIEARVDQPEELHLELDDYTFDQAVQAEKSRLAQIEIGLNDPLRRMLVKAADQFIVYRSSVNSPSVIAGYPWFDDWGRDTLIALPGLTLTTKRFSVARGLLKTFGKYCREGLIPNTFPDGESQPIYNSLDAALWWLETLGLYLEASQDWQFLREQYCIVRQIYKAVTAGTLFNIRIDAIDGLLTWDAPGVAITWMDAIVDGCPVTSRRGKPIEINALWYSTLCWSQQWAERLGRDATDDDAIKYANHARRYAQQVEQVKASLQKFWNPQTNYLHDTICPDDLLNPRIRPNAVIALSLTYCAFSQEQGRPILEIARDRLLTPYGLRSLERNDRGYVGRYYGGVRERDRAYHQGTVWSWLIGAFIRAWERFYPTEPLPFDWQPLLDHLQNQACLGSISEIFDGDAPHAARGAIAQAWSVAEVLRHWEAIPDCTHSID